MQRWRARCAADGGGPSAGAARAARMRAVNPLVIPRNLRVEEAIAAASDGDLARFERPLAALRRPYEERPGQFACAAPAPAAAMGSCQAFCGT